jgi:hypothetical protein
VGIASRFGSSVKSILDVNPDLDPASLKAGQIVAVPVIFARFAPLRPPQTRPRPTPGSAAAATSSSGRFDGGVGVDHQSTAGGQWTAGLSL